MAGPVDIPWMLPPDFTTSPLFFLIPRRLTAACRSVLIMLVCVLRRMTIYFDQPGNGHPLWLQKPLPNILTYAPQCSPTCPDSPQESDPTCEDYGNLMLDGGLSPEFEKYMAEQAERERRVFLRN